MADEIDELIDEVTVDPYGEDEQLWALCGLVGPSPSCGLPNSGGDGTAHLH